MHEYGIITGCDEKQEWLLEWWLINLRKYTDLPIAIADFGMSSYGVAWAKKHGIYVELKESLASEEFDEKISPETKQAWEKQFGKGVWKIRSAWLKKPYAFASTPFIYSVWLDLDCEVLGSIEPVFYPLVLGADITIVKDLYQKAPYHKEGEINYNSGVVGFYAQAPFIKQWISITKEQGGTLPGDQDTLVRTISLHAPYLIELPSNFNYYYLLPNTDSVVIRHYIGGEGKKLIIEKIQEMKKALV